MAHISMFKGFCAHEQAAGAGLTSRKDQFNALIG